MNEPADKQMSSTKQALLEIRKLRGELAEREALLSQPIALVGCGLRFPGDVNSVNEFWRFLKNGGDGIREIPADRWNADDYFDESRESAGTMYTRHAGFIDGVAEFDAAFFGISPREAESMDPQQRILLQLSWRALEDALISPASLKGSNTGVFIGFCNSDYSRLVFSDPRSPDVSAATGNEPSVAAGRISYTLGLHGPSMVVDTACSSSLVALHLAVQSLRKRECDIALVGGVNLILTPEMHINFCQAQMLSPDGQCKTFDASADGYGRGEGSAVVVAKRLSDALANGDRIYAVVKGSAVNQDGLSAGITAPNGIAQEDVIGRALDDAGLKPQDIDYVELHGTGTPLGDPIEARALGAAYGKHRDASSPLLVGSVKTNIGHLEAAAGIAGVIKAALSLYFGEIPAQRNFSRPNPEIPLKELNLRVTDTVTQWEQKHPAKAGVSSFGFGGTNSHVILEQPPKMQFADQPETSQVVSMSAESPELLEDVSRNLVTYLRQTTDKISEVAYASTAGRSHFKFRRSLVCDSCSSAADLLENISDDPDPQSRIWNGTASGVPRVIFAFTGQGAQYRGMGSGLYRTFPVFRDALDEAVELFEAALQMESLLAEIIENNNVTSESRIYVQPATFSIGYALFKLWSSWGVSAEVVMGHSLGEYVAAVAAGMMSLADAVELVAARVRLTGTISRPGRMAVVFAPAAKVGEVLVAENLPVDIAAINGPENTVVSGHAPVVDAALKVFAENDCDVRLLDIPHAFHSRELDAIVEDFEMHVDRIDIGLPATEFLSTVTGDFLGDKVGRTSQYWRSQLRDTVQFAAAISSLEIDENTIVLELGANPTLLPMIASLTTADCVLVASLSRDSDDLRSVANAISAMHTRGIEIDFDTYFRSRLDGGRPRPVTIPEYPFASTCYWLPDSRANSLPVPGEKVWNFVKNATHFAAASAPMELRAHELEESWALLRELSKRYIVNALVELQLFGADGKGLTIDSAMRVGGVEGTYRHLVKRWFDLLLAEGVIVQDRTSGEFAASSGLQVVDVEGLLETLRKRYSSEPFLVDYLQRCGETLTDVVTGKISALETLFPDGDSSTAELLYTEFSPSRYISNIAAESILSFAAARGRPISILEIGAGTGGTTSRILPSLPPGFGRYYFTDISDYFLARAAERFSEYDFVDYRLLDIGQNANQQTFAAHSQDVIVATNVLHATPDLRRTLQNVVRLLRSGGILVLCEVTRELDWYDISTGLIEGWQAFEDDLRDDSPILSADVWESALKDAGFVEVFSVPGKDSPAYSVGQNVIVGLAPESADISDVSSNSLTPSSASGVSEDRQRQDEFLADLESAPAAEQLDLLVDFVTDIVCRILRMPPESAPGADAGLFDMGMDSLLALDFRRRLATALRLDAPLPATLIFDCPTISAVARFLKSQILDLQPATKPSDAGDQEPMLVKRSVRDRVQDMSEDDVEAALLARLESPGKDS